MIKLQSATFARAIEKAQFIQPAVQLRDSDDSNFTLTVARSDGGAATVDVWFRGGICWSSCDCPAGTGHDGRRWPLPCYHVAAAALNLGFLPAALPLGAVLAPATNRAAGRQLPAPLADPANLAPAPTSPMSDSVWVRLGSLVRTFHLRQRGVRGAWLSARSSRA